MFGFDRCKDEEKIVWRRGHSKGSFYYVVSFAAKRYFKSSFNNFYYLGEKVWV